MKEERERERMDVGGKDYFIIQRVERIGEGEKSEREWVGWIARVEGNRTKKKRENGMAKEELNGNSVFSA